MIAEYLQAAESRGLSFSINGKTLMVSPRSGITESDREFIVANKPFIVAWLACRPVKQAPDKECCDVCPGVDSTLCAGCAGVIEYLMPDGRIIDNWCIRATSVQGATHFRNRWDKGEWTPIPK